MEEKAREWWNSWSRQYQTEYGSGEIPVAIDWGPGAPAGDDLGLLGDREGTRIIELGCGGAQFGLALAERGAEVTGVDISGEQLAHARRLAEEHDQDVELIEGSVTDLPVSDAAYDLAVSSWAFQWVADLGACFGEAHRVLRNGGRLAFSVDHPYYKIVDHETGEVERSYFDDAPRRTYSEDLGAEMVVYCRTVSEILHSLIEAGFAIEAVREPGSDDPEAYDSEFGSFVPERMADVPPTLVVAARK